MAAIPLYHQQQLESSRTGVPAMDESGQAMAQTLLSTSQALTHAGLNAQGQAVSRAVGQATQDSAMAAGDIQQLQAQTEYTRRQAIAQQAALVKAQATKLNNQDIENHVHRYTMDATDVVDAINADQTLAPEKRPQIVRQSLDNLRKQYAEQNPMNPDVAAGFTKGTDGQLESEYQKANTAVNSYRTQQAIDLQKDTENKMVKDTKSFEDFVKLEQTLQTPGQQNNFYGLHGSKAATAQTAVLKGAAENVFYNTVFENPIKAKEMIEKDAFGSDIFSGKEKLQLVSTANTKIEENIKTQESTDKVVAQLGKSAINNIYGQAITRTDATGYSAEIHQIDTIVKDEQKKPVYGPGHRNENVVNFGLERMEQLRKRKTDIDLAAAAAKSAAADVRTANAQAWSAKSQARTADVWERQDAARLLKEKIAEAPNQEMLLKAETATRMAQDLSQNGSKVDVATKLNMLDDAFNKLNEAHDKHLMSDNHWQDSMKVILARQQEIQRTLKTPSWDKQTWDNITNNTQGQSQNRYNVLLTQGAAPSVLKLRGAAGNQAATLAANAEHAYYLRRARDHFTAKNPGMVPTPQQYDNMEAEITTWMNTKGHN